MFARSRPAIRAVGSLAAVVIASAASVAHAQGSPAGTTHAAVTDAAAHPDAGLSAAEQARRAEALAHVGARTITVGELEDMLNQAPQPVRATYADPARRREFLENLIQMTLLAEEARHRGIDHQPEAASAVRRILAQRLEQTAVIEAITPASVTDADVQTYYNAHLSEFQQPEFRRATVVFTNDRPAADQVVTALRAARGDMRRVQAIVRERSVDNTTRDHDGDLFYFRRDGTTTGSPTPEHIDPAIAAAAFGLGREMDVSDPVQTANGKWAVAVLTGIRPALSRSITDAGVQSSIRGFIVRQRRTERQQQLVEDIRTRMHPEVHEDLLDLIHIPQQDLGNMPGFDPNAPPRRPPVPGAANAPPIARPPGPLPTAPPAAH